MNGPAELIVSGLRGGGREGGTGGILLSKTLPAAAAAARRLKANAGWEINIEGNAFLTERRADRTGLGIPSRVLLI